MGAVRRGPVGPRPSVDGRSAFADRRRLPRGGGRCRPRARGYRRPVHLSGPGGYGHERGRDHHGGGGPPPAPDMDQRGRRPPRSWRIRGSGDAGRGLRPLPSCAVFPDRLGVVVCLPWPGWPGRTPRIGPLGLARPPLGPFRGQLGCPELPTITSPPWRAPLGPISAPTWIAMNANQSLPRYGPPGEMLGLIALNGRANAARNPAAI